MVDGAYGNALPVCPEGTEPIPWSDQMYDAQAVDINSRADTFAIFDQVILCQTRYEFPISPRYELISLPEFSNVTLITNLTLTPFSIPNIYEIGPSSANISAVLTNTSLQVSTCGIGCNGAAFIYYYPFLLPNITTSSSQDIYIRDIFQHWILGNGTAHPYGIGTTACPYNFIDPLYQVGNNFQPDFPFSLNIDDTSYNPNPIYLCMSFDCIFPCENNGTRNSSDILDYGCSCDCPYPWTGKYCQGVKLRKSGIENNNSEKKI